jgi:hypothetical protein
MTPIDRRATASVEAVVSGEPRRTLAQDEEEPSDPPADSRAFARGSGRPRPPARPARPQVVRSERSTSNSPPLVLNERRRPALVRGTTPAVPICMFGITTTSACSGLP